MSYEIDHSDKSNYGSITVEDQTINLETSLSFVGKKYTGYAKVIAENFLHLLENFASSTAPTNPVIGQLWYDTNTISNPPQPQLKIWDGTTWNAAGGIKKSVNRPLAENSVIGDLWVDMANQQLYLWTGSTWILVGPQFSDGSQTGVSVQSILDTANQPHLVILIYIGDKPVTIISTEEFRPKLTISGFDTIKPGINLSTINFVAGQPNRLWGTAEKSAALVIGSNTIPASNFLRSDAANVTNFGISIRNNTGIVIGSDLVTSLSNTAQGETVLYNKTEGSRVFIRTNTNGLPTDIVTVFGNKVGINKTNPVEALDVVGNILASGKLTASDTTDTSSLTTGSIVTAGGVAVTKSIRVGQDATVVGTINSGSLIPNTNNTYDVGSSIKKWKSIYATEVTADNFYGTFSGQVSGSVTGTATRLASPTVFRLTGDVSSNNISFNGQQLNGEAVFTTAISSDFITTKTAVTNVLTTDEILINRVGVGLRKLSKQTFFNSVASVPIGTILPFAGQTPPTGYLLCDGSEQLIANYSELFSIIGYTYKDPNLLQGTSTFALPDLRGRFGLGADNMNNATQVPSKIDGSLISTINATADRVTNVSADSIGLGAGSEDKTIGISNLPDHEHDLKGSNGNQYYAFRNVPGQPSDTGAISGNGPTSAATGQYLPLSGGIDTVGTLGNPLNVMNPYLTINYIIFTGKL